MAEDKDDRKPPRPPREAKLAEALRANLRRRKAATSSGAAQKPHATRKD
jgi:hypothetical protein